MQDIYFIKQLSIGNKKVFEDLFTLHYGTLLLYASSIVGDHEIAKDLVQDVFLKVWERRKQITIETGLKFYLLKIMKNTCLDYLKHKEVTEKYSDYTKLELQKKEIDLLYAYFKDSQTEINESRIQQILIEIEKLPAQCQSIFKLSRFEGLKNKEIATKLSISTKTVDNQIFKALSILRGKLKDFAVAKIIFSLF